MWTNNDQNAIELYGAMQQVLKHNNIFLIFYTVIYLATNLVTSSLNKNIDIHFHKFVKLRDV